MWPIPSPPPQRGPGHAKFIGHVLGSLGVDRYATHALLIGLAVAAIWLTRSNVLDGVPAVVDVAALGGAQSAAVVNASPPVVMVAGAEFPVLAAADDSSAPLTRHAELHTNIPTRPRKEVITYTVQKGDTLFGIAEKFGITPETIVWGNPVLKDDPHLLRPDQQLRIAPVSGVLRDVQPGDRLDVLAKFYGVLVDEIINWPSNNIDPDNPQIAVGQLLVVPGGRREFVQFVVPQIRRTVKRALPADAGPGQCPGGYSGGAVGTGYFVWPSPRHWLSGNDYWSGHPGLDIASAAGDPIFAADSGVAVFAGWSNWGYGNMVVIDHGNGWQTLYAHLSQWNVSCGQSVLQGALIGLGGSTGNSTGPHLHFEMNYQGSRPNPWNYLPAP